MLELCGFGDSGDAFADKLGGKGQAAEDMAHELGRSVPGLHAGDLVRASRFLEKRSQRLGVKWPLSAWAVGDHIHTAALHAILASSADAPQHLMLLAPTASLAAAGSARFYSPSVYYSWIFGMLREYDLVDCLAAVLPSAQSASTSITSKGSSVLVLGPVDEMLHPLTAAQVNGAYAFATATADDGQLALIPGTFTELAAADKLLTWLIGPRL
jgi:hypothetical protein